MYNVLIVDDEPAVREGLSVMIDWRAYDFTVSATAKNGRDALNKLEAGRYDLVITDIRMPVFSGMDLIREIRKKSPHMIIMIISGYGEFEFAQRAIEYGVKAYLLKPVNRCEMQTNVVQAKMELDKYYRAMERKEDSASKKRYPKLIEQILEYTDINYAKDLNLKTVADIFFINPAYLGQLFIKYVNETYSHYLNKKRIEAAKGLLLNDRISANEIIEKVGYKGSDYFYKQFRRYENVSFSEYKDSVNVYNT